MRQEARFDREGMSGSMKKIWTRAALVWLALFIGLALSGAVAQAADSAPVITQQPVSMQVYSKKIVTFTVEAKGSGLQYQWYRRDGAGEKWEAWGGKRRSFLRVNTSDDMDGMQVRCVVSNTSGKVTSDTATLCIAPHIWSYDSTSSVSGWVGEKKTLKVEADGKDLKYQWYYKKGGETRWNVWAGKTDSSFDLVLSMDYNGWLFDCVVTAGNGMTASLRYDSTITASYSIKVKENQQGSVPTEATIYYLDDGVKDMLTIPEDLPQSLDLTGHEIQLKQSESRLENRDGILVPKKNKWYYHQLPSGYWAGSSGPSGAEDEVIREEYEPGDSVVTVDGYAAVTVHVVNYAGAYAEGVVDRYIDENITSDMTQYQKAEKCCQFVAGYDYGVEYQSYTGLIVMGRGDCWASTNTLLFMLPKLGISAKERFAAYDDGAGAGHYNVVAKLDGTDYILETGYNGKAPRPYFMKPYGSRFEYLIHADSTISIKTYVCLDGEAEIDVPSSIDGYTVTGIEEGAFSNNHTVQRVRLPATLKEIGNSAFRNNTALEYVDIPDGVTRIGDSAFALCDALESITIPASVQEIGRSTFFDCTSLKSITVSPDNQAFCSIDGVVYSKDMSTLVIVPAGRRGDYTVPEGVRTIREYAFGRSELGEVILPKSLRAVETHAFWFCSCKALVFKEGIESLSDEAVLHCNIKLVELPDTLKQIGTYALGSSGIETLMLSKKLEIIGPYAFAGNISLSGVRIPATVRQIGEGAFWTTYGWSSFDASQEDDAHRYGYVAFEKGCTADIGANAFPSVLVGVYEGSAAHKYAEENGVKYLVLDKNGRIPLDTAWFKIDDAAYFDGKPKRPTVGSAKNAPFSCLYLHANKDCVVTYSNNVLPGTATATIEGRDLFSGSVQLEFTIYPRDLTGDGFIRIDDTFYGLLGHEATSIYRLPAGTTEVAAGAFAGTPVEVAYIPKSVKKIAANAFDAGVVLVLEDDALADWAEQHGYYAIVD